MHGKTNKITIYFYIENRELNEIKPKKRHLLATTQITLKLQ